MAESVKESRENKTEIKYEKEAKKNKNSLDIKNQDTEDIYVD